jgi:hypothetical protein
MREPQLLRNLFALHLFTRFVDVAVVYVGASVDLDHTIASHFENFGHLDPSKLEPNPFAGLIPGVQECDLRTELGLPGDGDLSEGYHLFTGGVWRGCVARPSKADDATSEVVRPLHALISRERLGALYEAGRRAGSHDRAKRGNK